MTRTFGEWMTERRESLGWKPVDCAERAGLTPQAWSNWENDRSRRKDGSPSRPTPETIEKIAQGLGVPTVEVLRAAGYTAEHGGSDYDPTILAYYNDLPDEVQDDVKAIIETMWRKHRRAQTDFGKKPGEGE